MDKINEILNNKLYKDSLIKLTNLEENRIFCKHGIEHLLDVARIAYIMVLEENLPFSKDVIYASALLHDIGRVLEYEENIPHHEGSVILAKKILNETSYSGEEIKLILEGISNHRDNSASGFSYIIYKSDKLCRNCFLCKSEDKCNWSKQKKNDKITY